MLLRHFNLLQRTLAIQHRPLSTQPLYSSKIIHQYRARQQQQFKARNRSLLLYAVSVGVVTLGLSYAAVPLYRVFCSVTGYNGTPQTSKDGSGKFAPDRISQPVGQKTLTIRFNADKSDTLNWKFWPCQKSLQVKPGETVLAFYKAKNLADHDILGVATYNVTPGQVCSPTAHHTKSRFLIIMFRLPFSGSSLLCQSRMLLLR